MMKEIPIYFLIGLCWCGIFWGLIILGLLHQLFNCSVAYVCDGKIKHPGWIVFLSQSKIGNPTLWQDIVLTAIFAFLIGFFGIVSWPFLTLGILVFCVLKVLRFLFRLKKVVNGKRCLKDSKAVQF